VDQFDKIEAFEQEKPLYQDSSELFGIMKTPSNTKEDWKMVVKKKKSPPASQPTMTRSQDPNPYYIGEPTNKGICWPTIKGFEWFHLS
jgi:hypothetical protein